MLTHGLMHMHACGQPLMHIIHMVGHTQAQALPCTHAHVYTHTHAHLQVHTYTYLHACAHTHTCPLIRTHSHTCVYTLTCTHAHGHAHAQPSSHMTPTPTNTFMALLGATFSPAANRAGKPPRRFGLALGYPYVGQGRVCRLPCCPTNSPPTSPALVGETKPVRAAARSLSLPSRLALRWGRGHRQPD